MAIELLHIDCMEYMAKLPDTAFNLAIVDPDYGIGENWKKDRKSKFYTHTTTYKNKSIPTKEYFDELFRVSEYQIIWGGNYYTEFLPARNSWIVWDKDRSFDDSHMAEGELAWTSFNIPLRIIRNRWNGFLRSEKRHGKHPHEKPVGLYKWILKHYGKLGGGILDTHGGSMSSAIACHQMGFDLTLCEIDKQYYDDGVNRVSEAMKQQSLFNT